MNKNQKTNQNYQDWNTVRELDTVPRERSNVYIGAASFIILIGVFIIEGIIEGLGIPILEWGLIILMFFVVRRIYQEGITQGRARTLEDIEKEQEIIRRNKFKVEDGSMDKDSNEINNQKQSTESTDNQVMNYDPYTGEKLR